jgi:hypothetical protein
MSMNFLRHRELCQRTVSLWRTNSLLCCSLVYLEYSFPSYGISTLRFRHGSQCQDIIGVLSQSIFQEMHVGKFPIFRSLCIGPAVRKGSHPAEIIDRGNRSQALETTGEPRKNAGKESCTRIPLSLFLVKSCYIHRPLQEAGVWRFLHSTCTTTRALQCCA